MTRKKLFNKNCVLAYTKKCSKCGKNYFTFNQSDESEVCSIMEHDNICWECAYWQLFKFARPKHLEIIGSNCYQVLPFVENAKAEDILGGGGKTKYILKKDSTCVKSNDIWWLNTIPYQYQQTYKPTAWWVTKHFYDTMQKVKKPCKAKGCLDRYRCYRYLYQQEFDKEPYNKVPKDWVAGGEHCGAFLPLREIKDYDEYVKSSDIIDESSVV